ERDGREHQPRERSAALGVEDDARDEEQPIAVGAVVARQRREVQQEQHGQEQEQEGRFSEQHGSMSRVGMWRFEFAIRVRDRISDRVWDATRLGGYCVIAKIRMCCRGSDSSTFDNVNPSASTSIFASRTLILCSGRMGIAGSS